MSFQNNLCDLRVLGGGYVTAIRARRTSEFEIRSLYMKSPSDATRANGTGCTPKPPTNNRQ